MLDVMPTECRMAVSGYVQTRYFFSRKEQPGGSVSEEHE